MGLRCVLTVDMLLFSSAIEHILQERLRFPGIVPVFNALVEFVDGVRHGVLNFVLDAIKSDFFIQFGELSSAAS